MTNHATKTYQVTVIERALAFYEVDADDARTAAENWSDGEYEGRDDELLDTEGPTSVRERQPNGAWRKVPESEWKDDAEISHSNDDGRIASPESQDPSRRLIAALRAVLPYAKNEGLSLAACWKRDRYGVVRYEMEACEKALADARDAISRTIVEATPSKADDKPVGNTPYSVLLFYPDFLNDGGTETYYAWVAATDPLDAVAVAQRQAAAAQVIDIDDPTDFAPLLVTQGHHYGEALFNK